MAVQRETVSDCMPWTQSPQLVLCSMYQTCQLHLQNLGTDWDERVLPSIGNEIVKAVVAQYNAEQLLTQRDKVSRAVRSHARCEPISSSINTLTLLPLVWHQFPIAQFAWWRIVKQFYIPLTFTALTRKNRR